MQNTRFKFSTAIATGTFGFGLMLTGAYAADVDMGCTTAVSALNGKIEGAAGYYEDETSEGARFQGIASLSFPLGCLFGAQIDFGGGDLDGDGFVGIGGHLFMRDPSSYLLGIHAQYINLSGEDVIRVGPEAELYLDNVTLSGMVGFEDVQQFNTDDIVAQLGAAYYVHDNFAVNASYRHFLSIDAGAIGFEYQPETIPGSLFVDAMVGTDHYTSIMGGLRFYFGGDGKSLKARHREDDPAHYFNLLTRQDEACVVVPTDGVGNDCGGNQKNPQP